MKALEMLKQNKTVEQRADSYIKSIKRNIQRDVIDALTAKKESIDDRIFELSDMTLSTDLNKGLTRMTKDEAEKRFKEIIDLEYQRTLISLELEEKTKSFKTYFGDE